MQVAMGLEALPKDDRPSIVTVGVFDGVHRGHQAVLDRTVEVAQDARLPAVAVTFDRHPRQTLTPGREPPLITTLERKLALIRARGVDAAVVLPFDQPFSERSPQWFVEEVLARGLEARAVVVGENFTFGHLGQGTVATLQEAGPALGFTAEGVGLVEIDGRTVSSSSVRAAVGEGDLTWPTQALGRRFAVDGRVVRGAGRGLGLGFPTANLEIPAKMLLPGRGIYAGRAVFEGGSHPAAIDVGTNPTFGWELLHVEAFLLDFDGDLSGVEMSLELWARLRDELRFESVDELVRQMAEDVERTRAVVGGRGPDGSATTPRAAG
jgi:riboflavin kinase/FMN adenylyltransferase